MGPAGGRDDYPADTKLALKAENLVVEVANRARRKGLTHGKTREERNMKTTRIFALSLTMTVGFLEAGCATTKQARNVTPQTEGDSAVLGDYGALLQKGTGDEALLTYKNPAANWPAYTKIIIMPVKFQKPEKASEDELNDLQTLANNAQGLMNQQLGQDVQIVTEPGPNTLRMELALYNAGKKRVVMNFISGVAPIGMATNLAVGAARGKVLGVGELSAEMKVTDASTAELLAAAVDRRVGRKYQAAQFESWGEANDAIDYWAKRTRYVLCNLRAMPACVKP